MSESGQCQNAIFVHVVRFQLTETPEEEGTRPVSWVYCRTVDDFSPWLDLQCFLHTLTEVLMKLKINKLINKIQTSLYITIRWKLWKTVPQAGKISRTEWPEGRGNLILTRVEFFIKTLNSRRRGGLQHRAEQQDG